MDTLWQIGISNAVAAVVLALVAGTASVLWRRRPALVHGLWLLVLLKLLTPPLVRVPIPDILKTQESPAPVATASPEAAQSREKTEVADPEVALPELDLPLVAEPDRKADEAESRVIAEEAPVCLVPSPVPAAASSAPAFEMPDWRTAVQMVWLSGTAFWFLLAWVRSARFSRLLRHARPAPVAVQEEADRIAVALGMKWCPTVELLPGRLAPMVWGLGTPRLFLPAELIGQLDDGSISTLMAHELAHLRRGDNHVRLVEFVALGLFWWHPVAWIARRTLREAEEQCCDAWVVSALPGTGKTYATALLETLDFLSAAPASPPLACGIGQVSDLKRRLTMIMRGATPRALCWREGLAVLGLAALLPLLPTLARAEPDEQSGNKPVPARTEEKRVIALRFEDKSDDGDKGSKSDADKGTKSAEVDRARAELKKLEAELQKKVAEVREASMRLKEAAEKIHRVEFEKAKEMAKGLAKDITKEVQDKIRREVRVEVDGQQLRGRKVILDGPIEIEVTADGHTKVHKIETRIRADGPETTTAVPAQQATEARDRADAGRKAAEAARESARGRRHSEGQEEGQRMDQLERKLEAVLRELETIRKDRGAAIRTDKDKEKTESQPKERKRKRDRSEEEDDSI